MDTEAILTSLAQMGFQYVTDLEIGDPNPDKTRRLGFHFGKRPAHLPFKGLKVLCSKVVASSDDVSVIEGNCTIGSFSVVISKSTIPLEWRL